MSADDTDPGPTLEAARATLYAAPLSEFVERRARLAAELRGKGEKALARQVLALRKPSAAAWGINRLAQRDPARLDALYEARASAERVQAEGKADELRPAILVYRTRLDALVDDVEACLVGAGAPSSKDHLRGVRETLEAAAKGPGEARAALASGCLVQPVGADEAELDALALSMSRRELAAEAPTKRAAPLAPALPPPAPPPASNVVALADKRRREQAKRRLDETMESLRDATAKEAAARHDVANAEARLATAARDVELARERVEAARSAVAALGASPRE